MAINLHVPSLVDSLHAVLREQILTGEIPSGEPLTENDLATRYSVARPTAKAAMERLVHDGLLTRPTNKTARVPVLGLTDLRDLYYSRCLLEREVIAELCARRLVPDEARRQLQTLRALVPRPDLAEVVAADVGFHQALVAALLSPRLDRLYTSLMGEVRLCMAQVQAHNLLEPERIADEHEAILNAIGDGDAQRGIAEVNSHLDRACTRLVAYLEKSQEAAALGRV